MSDKKTVVSCVNLEASEEENEWGMGYSAY